MKQVFRFMAIFAVCVVIFSGCDDKKIDSNIISQGSTMSAEAQEKAKSLDKESYKDLADLFLDTATIDFSREVLIIFGKNQCKYCDMLKDDIKKSPAIQSKIKEHFNPYYINTSYDKVHKLRAFRGKDIDINIANLAQIFGVNTTPQVIFMDKNGRVKYLFAGYTLQFEKMIDDVVATSAPLGDYVTIDKALNAL